MKVSGVKVFVLLAVVMGIAVWACSLCCGGGGAARHMEYMDATDKARFVVYGSMRCGYTRKQLDYMKAHGMSHRFVDVDTPTGERAFREVRDRTGNGEVRGVPFTVDTRDPPRTYAGFSEINL